MAKCLSNTPRQRRFRLTRKTFVLSCPKDNWEIDTRDISIFHGNSAIYIVCFWPPGVAVFKANQEDAWEVSLAPRRMFSLGQMFLSHQVAPFPKGGWSFNLIWKVGKRFKHWKAPFWFRVLWHMFISMSLPLGRSHVVVHVVVSTAPYLVSDGTIRGTPYWYEGKKSNMVI